MLAPPTSLLSLLLLLIAVPAQGQERSWPTDILHDTFGISSAAQIDAPLDEIHQGCPRRDCIPSIDDPEFVKAEEAEDLDDDDLVLGLDHAGVVRAYPAFILNFHEIVNGRVEVRALGGQGPELLPMRMFWFAWYSFNTDTALRDIEK